MIRHLGLCALLCIASLHTVAKENPPVVAVASNFSPALENIVEHFNADTGMGIRISSGASGTLVRQIQQGAPFQIFMSADESYVLKLYEQGLTEDKGRIYATGKVVLYIPETSPLHKLQSADSILRSLVSDNSYRIAIANPELAPYGQAAQQILNRYITSSMLQNRMILGENVGQTAQFALTGSVDAAFLPYALALTGLMQDAGRYENIPEDWYSPINQRMVLLKNANHVARKFYDYLVSETAQQIIRNYGYSLPPTD